MKSLFFKLSRHERRVVLFTSAYLFAGVIYCLVSGNSEFLFYIFFVMIPAIVIIAALLPFLSIPSWAVWGISIFGLMHILGGISIGPGTLYDFVLFPLLNNGPDGLTFIRYDQIVHTFGSALAALYAYYCFARFPIPRFWLFIIAALAAMGLGSLNEVVEFAAKNLFPHTDVGGYYNNTLDLVFNMIGATVASAIAVKLWGTHPPHDGASLKKGAQ